MNERLDFLDRWVNRISQNLLKSKIQNENAKADWDWRGNLKDIGFITVLTLTLSENVSMLLIANINNIQNNGEIWQKKGTLLEF